MIPKIYVIRAKGKFEASAKVPLLSFLCASTRRPDSCELRHCSTISDSLGSLAVSMRLLPNVHHTLSETSPAIVRNQGQGGAENFSLHNDSGIILSVLVPCDSEVYINFYVCVEINDFDRAAWGINLSAWHANVRSRRRNIPAVPTLWTGVPFLFYQNSDLSA